jgi:hypothetical protein
VNKLSRKDSVRAVNWLINAQKVALRLTAKPNIEQNTDSHPKKAWLFTASPNHWRP